jgi:formamidopyrimidine-DNA glycosylase
MDQRVVAGLGNLLTDEILWRARLHPDRQTETLDSGAWNALHGSMQRTLRESITYGHVPRRH